MATMLRMLGRYTEALEMLRSAEQVLTRMLPAWHDTIAGLMNEGYLVYRALGNYTESITRVNRLLESQLHSSGPLHPKSMEYAKRLQQVLRLAGIGHAELEFLDGYMRQLGVAMGSANLELAP